MRFLPIFLLIAGCANDPVTLYDGLGEVPTEGPITMDQIDFTEQGVSLDRIEDCLDLEEIEVGVLCNADTAKVELDSEQWSIDEVDTSMAQYNVDTFSELPWADEIVWAWQKKPQPRWAECGCPDGCNDSQCNWEPTEDNGYVCTGTCAGTHCSECTVELVQAPETTGPAS
jgi:hypothetical protein